MTNADRVRAMTDEQLQSFVWWWQINALTAFMKGGGFGALPNVTMIYEWLQSETFKCEMTKTPDDWEAE